jgi:activator of 2-hydroxyglutaryl-CoA dehydratase
MINASGTGIFLESMAKALGVPLAEMGELVLLSKRPVAISSMCAVFAESEIVSISIKRFQNRTS